MPRFAGAALLSALWIAAAGPAAAQTPAAPAQPAATVSCPFSGKAVHTVIKNANDMQRSCNATCVWSYAGNVPYRGAGGAILAAGETKMVYNSVAPVKIDTAVASGITCDK
jgi:hypothetical protein